MDLVDPPFLSIDTKIPLKVPNPQNAPLDDARHQSALLLTHLFHEPIRGRFT